jgi:hypothetical protein
MKLLAGLLCAHVITAHESNSTMFAGDQSILVAGDSWVRALWILSP